MGSNVVEKRGFGFAVVIMCLMISTSVGSIHKVGDSAGWTTIANVDYYHWALTKSFQLGDVVVFEYNPEFHNVMRVTHAEYKACNASSPISTHTTGNDSIIIDTRGHHFFICGVPGHCQAGQKVDINVPRAPSVAPSESGSASPAPAFTTEAPAPSNGAINMHLHQMGWLLLLHCLWIILISHSQFTN